LIINLVLIEHTAPLFLQCIRYNVGWSKSKRIIGRDIGANPPWQLISVSPIVQSHQRAAFFSLSAASFIRSHRAACLVSLSMGCSEIVGILPQRRISCKYKMIAQWSISIYLLRWR